MSEKVRIQLGCGQNYRPGWVNCDMVRTVKADRYFDLETFPWPFEDNFADEIVMEQVLEHLTDTVKSMGEIHRILKPGGVVRIEVPYAKADVAYNDPTHKRFFTEKTMDYFAADAAYNFYSPYRFRILRAELVAADYTGRAKLRNLIPFRKYLRWFLWNMYDGVVYEMQKVPHGTAGTGAGPQV